MARMKDRFPKLLLLLTAGMILLNLVQAHFTELLFDEAYYWYYARNLDWGYFDHPPMVAVLVSISEWFFSGELGVRFMSTLMSGGLMLLLWLLVDRPGKNRYALHFFVLVFSMTLVNAYGFFTLPDTPLLFFTALFLYLYKKFTDRPGWILAIGLGVVMACLLYSKYHGVLVILFVFLSNPRLALNKMAWGAVATGVLCYTPHLYWLFENDFVSLKYHLFERPNRAYEFADFTLGYLINLVALFGFVFPWAYKALWKTRPGNTFTRALLYLAYGVLLFFFISSFQRRVQTQWIILACIPMAILIFRHILDHPTDRKWVLRTGIANIAILLVLRIGLVYEPLFPIVFETHGNKEWVSAIEPQVGDTPVVFENSYREAPMYAFYAGNPAFSLNNTYYRKNQYDIDGSEDFFRGKKVLYIAKRFKTGDIAYQNAKGRTYYGNFMKDFRPYRRLTVEVPEEGVPVFRVHNPYDHGIPVETLRFSMAFSNPYKQVQTVVPLEVKARQTNTQLPAGGSMEFEFKMPPVPVSGEGHFKIVISEYGLYSGLNGDSIKLNAWNP